MIYRHNEHFISLTALPAQTASPPQALVIEGYSVQVWRDGSTDYWAIGNESLGLLYRVMTDAGRGSTRIGSAPGCAVARRSDFNSSAGSK